MMKFSEIFLKINYARETFCFKNGKILHLSQCVNVKQNEKMCYKENGSQCEEQRTDDEKSMPCQYTTFI